MNGQIVLCRGLNDGEQLERTVRDLASLHPAMASVSVVPVGLTKYREGLYPLEPFSPAEAGEVVSRLERISRKLLRGLGPRLVFPGDEFYLKAGLPIPPAGAYEGFPQLENGVGLVASMREEFERGLSALPEEPARPGEKRECSVATGTAAYPFIKGLVDALMKKCHNLTVHVYGVENDFFGPNVTVAGLLTGRDLEGRLKGRRLGRKLFLPRVMLRSEGDLFLDSMSPPELSERLGVPVDFIPCDGFALIEKLTKRE
jgi:putative radical SAM enzyme (TIGR03279 family)